MAKGESSKGREPKFRVGQVVAECYDFHNGKGEFICSYFVLNATLTLMANHNHVQEKSTTRTRYWRALTARERGA